MKRGIPAILTLALLLAALSVCALAAGPSGAGGMQVTRVASLSEATGKPGESVTVELSLSRQFLFSNLSFQINYDDTALELVAVERSAGTLSKTLFTASQSLDTRPYAVIWAADPDETAEAGTIATFTFAVRETARSGEYPVTLDYFHGVIEEYTDGRDVNFWSYSYGGNSCAATLGLTYQSGKVTVEKADVSLSVLQTGMTGCTARVSGIQSVDGGWLFAALYSAGGQMKELRMIRAEEETNAITFTRSTAGDRIKCILLTSGCEPACAAKEIILSST